MASARMNVWNKRITKLVWGQGVDCVYREEQSTGEAGAERHLEAQG